MWKDGGPDHRVPGLHPVDPDPGSFHHGRKWPCEPLILKVGYLNTISAPTLSVLFFFFLNCVWSATMIFPEILIC